MWGLCFTETGHFIFNEKLRNDISEKHINTTGDIHPKMHGGKWWIGVISEKHHQSVCHSAQCH
jgi:hypothetical protein